MRTQDQSAGRETGYGGTAPRAHRPAPAAVPPRLALAGGSPSALLDLQRTAGNTAVARSAARDQRLHTQRAAVDRVLSSPGTPIPEPERREAQARIGADLGHVRLHEDAGARRAAAEVNALAFTSGDHVVIGHGGNDRRTRYEEFIHTLQQRRGPVAGTDSGNGLRISDPDDRHEREARAGVERALSRPAPATAPETGRAEGRPPPAAGPSLQRAATAVQRAPGSQPQAPQGQQTPDPDPAAAAHAQWRLNAALRTHVENTYIRSHAPELLNWAADPHLAAPYRHMADDGELWQRAARDTDGPRLTGRAFVADQSARNVADLEDGMFERPAEWMGTAFDRLFSALGSMALHHYTTFERVTRMFPGGERGELKSKDKLQLDDPARPQPHHTQQQDRFYLANTGFVFFFIGRPDEPFRDTRFSAGGRPARVTVPMSRLERDGWVMLNDFVDQEYPTIRSDRDGHTIRYKRGGLHSPELKMDELARRVRRCWFSVPDLEDKLDDLSLQIWLALRADPAHPPAGKIVELLQHRDSALKVFDQLHRTGAPDFLTPFGELTRELDRQMAVSLRFDRQVRRFDPHPQGSDQDLMGGTMRHIDGAASRAVPSGRGAAADRRKLTRRYTEHLSGNILAGPHVVPGLAARGVLEMARVDAAGGNEALLDRWKAMPGDELAEVLLRDLIRPQAMLPWSVPIHMDDISVRP
jgi:hypothetical protein